MKTNKPGRPKLKDTVQVSINIFKDQRKLFDELGGSAWIRNQIELTKSTVNYKALYENAINTIETLKIELNKLFQ